MLDLYNVKVWLNTTEHTVNVLARSSDEAYGQALLELDIVQGKEDSVVVTPLPQRARKPLSWRKNYRLR